MPRQIKHHDGREIRGLRVKCYPTPEQALALLDLQRRLRRLWNWLVARSSDTRAAREAWASRNGAGTRPARPENDAGEQAWATYKTVMSEWRARVRSVLELHKKDPGLAYRNVRDYIAQFGVEHDYQLYPHLFDDDQPPLAHPQQALFKDYEAAMRATARGQRPPRRRKRDEDMPLRVGSGTHFRQVADGGRRVIGHHPKGPQMSGRINCQVSLPGIGWINATISSEQPLEAQEYWVEGVALRREADGWYAAIRQHVVPTVAPKGVGACGIDVGLVYLFAAVGNDGQQIVATNPRLGSRRGHLRTPGGYVELIAERQAAKLPTTILQCRSARNVRQVVREQLFPFTDRYEFIAVENLPANIGFLETPHLSFMRTVRAMLVQRYGCERVIDVDPTNTSRICSKCGHLCNRSWSDLPGRVGICPACGHSEMSDLNAARNVLHRLSKPLSAE